VKKARMKGRGGTVSIPTWRVRPSSIAMMGIRCRMHCGNAALTRIHHHPRTLESSRQPPHLCTESPETFESPHGPHHPHAFEPPSSALQAPASACFSPPYPSVWNKFHKSVRLQVLASHKNRSKFLQICSKDIMGGRWIGTAPPCRCGTGFCSSLIERPWQVPSRQRSAP